MTVTLSLNDIFFAQRAKSLAITHSINSETYVRFVKQMNKSEP